jgi:AbrB family looped-hinge helix DNA binding protein
MTVTVSSKYQVVIPEDIRHSVGIHPGQKIEVIKYGDHIALVPIPDPKTMRGFMKGIDPSGLRDKKDRL